jgi:hypothetical protein
MTMNERHGLSLGIERISEEFIVVLKARGKLTHDDYEVMTPMLNSALDGISHPHIKILADISEFEGWELRAAWDDFKLGLKLGTKVNKIAIYGHKNWQELAAKISNWFVLGDVRSFSDYESAINWLGE